MRMLAGWYEWGFIMNMSLSELYSLLVAFDFPSLSMIWTWLVSVPWWLAIGTAAFTIFAVRTLWSMTFYFFNWLFDSTFKTGEKFGEWLQAVKRQITAMLELGRLVKKRLFP